MKEYFAQMFKSVWKVLPGKYFDADLFIVFHLGFPQFLSGQVCSGKLA